MTRSRAISQVLVLLSFAMSAASAGPLQTEPVGVGELLKVSAGLLVVIAAIIATAAVLRRLKSMHGAKGAHMRVIDGISVSTRDRVVLLEVDRRRLLLGVSPGRIETLYVFAGESDSPTPFATMVERAAVSEAGADPR